MSKNAQVGTLPKPIPPTPIRWVGLEIAPPTLERRLLSHQVPERVTPSTFDPATGDTLYFMNGESITQGVEAESTILAGGGLAVYLNATKGSANTPGRTCGAERAQRYRDGRRHL